MNILLLEPNGSFRRNKKGVHRSHVTNVVSGDHTLQYYTSSAVAPPTQIEANVRKRVIVQRAAGHPFFLLDACVKKHSLTAHCPLELRRDCNAPPPPPPPPHDDACHRSCLSCGCRGTPSRSAAGCRSSNSLAPSRPQLKLPLLPPLSIAVPSQNTAPNPF
jgi:hypothetical protein